MMSMISWSQTNTGSSTNVITEEMYLNVRWRERARSEEVENGGRDNGNREKAFDSRRQSSWKKSVFFMGKEVRAKQGNESGKS